MSTTPKGGRVDPSKLGMAARTRGLSLSRMREPEHQDAPMFPTAKVHPDPDQPRIEKDGEKVREFEASMRANIDAGKPAITIPLVLVKHPTILGEWMIGFGESRWQAATNIGLEQVPGNVRDAAMLDVISQLQENVNRHGMTPKDIGRGIRRAVDSGMSKGEVAERLGMTAGTVSKHLAMLDLPPSVDALYEAKRCRALDYLYALKGLHTKNAEVVDRWCATVEKVSRAALDDLRGEIEGQVAESGKKPPAASQDGQDGTRQANGSAAGRGPLPARDKKRGGQAGTVGWNGQRVRLVGISGTVEIVTEEGTRHTVEGREIDLGERV